MILLRVLRSLSRFFDLLPLIIKRQGDEYYEIELCIIIMLELKLSTQKCVV